MLTYNTAPLIITILFLIGGLSTIILLRKNKKDKDKITQDFINQLKVATGESLEESRKITSDSLIGKWNLYWGKKLKNGEIVSNKFTNEQVGTGVIFSILVIYAINCLIFRNLGIGIIPLGLLFGVIELKASAKIEEKQKNFEEQIPNFISILKSNIQAAETPERALINAIENTDDPLYTELKIAKNLSETGSFAGALNALRKQTDNETLKFLCGCIEISAKVGANLEEQLEIIEDMLQGKRALQRKLDVAVAENRPLVYVSSALIPFLFLFTYFTSQQSRDFWFHSLLSWVIFGLIVGIFVGALALTNKIIKNTGKF